MKYCDFYKELGDKYKVKKLDLKNPEGTETIDLDDPDLIPLETEYNAKVFREPPITERKL